MLRTDDEMAAQSLPEPPALDLDDRLDQIRDNVQKILKEIEEYATNFEACFNYKIQLIFKFQLNKKELNDRVETMESILKKRQQRRSSQVPTTSV